MTKNRTGNQSIAGDPVLFPNGMKALADYVHAKGALGRAMQAPVHRRLSQPREPGLGGPRTSAVVCMSASWTERV